MALLFALGALLAATAERPAFVRPPGALLAATAQRPAFVRPPRALPAALRRPAP